MDGSVAMNINQKAERVYELASQFGFDVERTSESMVIIQKKDVDPIAIEVIDNEPTDGDNIRVNRGLIVDVHEVAVKFKMLGLVAFMSELGDFYVASSDNLMTGSYLIPISQEVPFEKGESGFRSDQNNDHHDKDNLYKISPIFHPIMEVLAIQKGEYRGIKKHPTISYFMANPTKTKRLRRSGIMAEGM